jgi:hypothetical protein
MTTYPGTNRTVAISIRTLTIGGLFVLLLLAANVVLLMRARSLAQVAQSLYDKQLPTVGVPFPELHGQSPTGKHFDFFPSFVPRRTLVLVLSFTCKPCETNWPTWEKLEAANKNGNTLFIDLPGNAPLTYFAYHHVRIESVLQKLDPETQLMLNIRSTPTTFIVDKRGAIIASWAGVLTKDAETEALKYLINE